MLFYKNKVDFTPRVLKSGILSMNISESHAYLSGVNSDETHGTETN